MKGSFSRWNKSQNIHKQLSSKRPFFCMSIKTCSPTLPEKGRPYNGKVNTQWHLWAFCSKWSPLATNYKHALSFFVLWNTHSEFRVNKCKAPWTPSIVFKEFRVNTPHLSMGRKKLDYTVQLSDKMSQRRSHSKSPQTLSSWRVYLHNSILTKCIELPFQEEFWQLVQRWGSLNEWIWMFSKPQFCNNSPFTTDFLFSLCAFI